MLLDEFGKVGHGSGSFISKHLGKRNHINIMFCVLIGENRIYNQLILFYIKYCHIRLNQTNTKHTSSLPLGKNLSVGKLEILTSATSLAVESILAMTTSSLSANFSPSSSQMGAICLQWPHHGASANEKSSIN